MRIWGKCEMNEILVIGSPFDLQTQELEASSQLSENGKQRISSGGRLPSAWWSAYNS